MRIPHLVRSLAATALLLGCAKAKPKPIDVGSVLPNIPLPPQAEALDRQGGTDALQFLFTSPVSPDSVTQYYRTVLSAGVWRLINERTTDKTTEFYAEQDGPSLWVTVSPNGSGSQVLIAGAADSASQAAMKAKARTAGDSGAVAPLPAKKP